MKSAQRIAQTLSVAAILVAGVAISPLAGAAPTCDKAGAALSRLASVESQLSARIATLTTKEQTAQATGHSVIAGKISLRLTYLQDRQATVAARIARITDACPNA